LADKGISTKPPVVRWGIMSVSSTILMSVLAVDLAALAIWLTVYYAGGKVVTGILWVLAIIMLVIFAGVVAGLVILVRLGKYWLKNQYEPTSDKLIRGIARGVLGKKITSSMEPIADVDSETEEIGVKIGKYIKARLNNKNNSIRLKRR
jgi:hypothetical protein